MKVLLVKTNNTVRAVQIFTQGKNEVPWADLRKLMPGNPESIYLNRISRLAFLYLMFVDKHAAERPLNKFATLLLSDPTSAVHGDVVITRTDHLGSGSKLLALEDHEIDSILERLSKYSKTKVTLSK